MLNRLLQFEEMYKFLRELINEGRSLLDSEKPVGDSAEKIAQQTATCQVWMDGQREGWIDGKLDGWTNR